MNFGVDKKFRYFKKLNKNCDAAYRRAFINNHLIKNFLNDG